MRGALAALTAVGCGAGAADGAGAGAGAADATARCSHPAQAAANTSGACAVSRRTDAWMRVNRSCLKHNRYSSGVCPTNWGAD